MAYSFTLEDNTSYIDLLTFLGRAQRAGAHAVRMICNNRILACYVSIINSKSLQDSSATIIGMKAWTVKEDFHEDHTLAIRALLDRRARIDAENGGISELNQTEESSGPNIKLPVMKSNEAWAGILPPKEGWHLSFKVSIQSILNAVHAGNREVASASGKAIGELALQKIRSNVWNTPIESQPELLSGVAFTAFSLGFIPREISDSNEYVPVLTNKNWQRIDLPYGYVIVRNKYPFTL